ncbi:MAG: DMT family transporter [Pseudomonadota bacterium]
MRLFLLTALTMVAFAANSVLNRIALADGWIGPADFAALRLASGAMALVALVYASGGRVPWGMARRPYGAAALLLYLVGFSFAYVTLDAGVGALILFGGVQVTMFAGALWLGERPGPRRWLGAAVAFSGLIWLSWPAGAVRLDPGGVMLMLLGALGWGLYSLLGRGSTAPLPATAANFALAIPVGALVWLAVPDVVAVTWQGVVLALLSGVVTSGMGYALWYTVLPQLEASAAALAQLTVPVIAAAGGALFLAEVLDARTLISGALVLAGVAIGSLAPSARPAPTDRK